MGFFQGELFQSPIIKDKQVDFGKPVPEGTVLPLKPGIGQAEEKIRNPEVRGGDPLGTGGPAQGAGKVGFSYSGRTGDEDVQIFPDISVTVN
jgi:hypothetical protein